MSRLKGRSTKLQRMEIGTHALASEPAMIEFWPSATSAFPTPSVQDFRIDGNSYSRS